MHLEFKGQLVSRISTVCLSWNWHHCYTQLSGRVSQYTVGCYQEETLRGGGVYTPTPMWKMSEEFQTCLGNSHSPLSHTPSQLRSLEIESGAWVQLKGS